MLNNKEQSLIFSIVNNTPLLDNSLSNIMFTEPINKSDQTGLKQQEQFLREELKSTLSTND